MAEKDWLLKGFSDNIRQKATVAASADEVEVERWVEQALRDVLAEDKAKNSASDMIGGCSRLLFGLDSKRINEEDLLFPDDESWPNIIKNVSKDYGVARRKNRSGLGDSIRHIGSALRGKGLKIASIKKAWGDLNVMFK